MRARTTVRGRAKPAALAGIAASRSGTGDGLEGWVDRSLGALTIPGRAMPGGPAARLVFGAPHSEGHRFGSEPFGAGDGHLWADPGGRTAVLPLADLDCQPVIVDPLMRPEHFVPWVLLPVARAVLSQAGGCVMYAAGVKVGSTRVAVASWSARDRSAVLIELLAGGAQLLGGEWMAVHPGGTVAPVASYVPIYERPRSTRAACLRAASSMTRVLPRLSRGLARAADGCDDRPASPVMHADGRGAGTAGRLDAVIVLGSPGCEPPRTRAELAEMLVAAAEPVRRPSAALEAGFRYAFPHRTAVLSLPRSAERSLISSGLRNAEIIVGPRTADQILQFVGPPAAGSQSVRIAA